MKGPPPRCLENKTRVSPLLPNLAFSCNVPGLVGLIMDEKLLSRDPRGFLGEGLIFDMLHTDADLENQQNKHETAKESSGGSEKPPYTHRGGISIMPGLGYGSKSKERILGTAATVAWALQCPFDSSPRCAPGPSRSEDLSSLLQRIGAAPGRTGRIPAQHRGLSQAPTGSVFASRERALC